MKIAITIIDAPCGQGKTSWAIEQFCKNKEKQYIYVTPFLDEIDRIRDATKGSYLKPFFDYHGLDYAKKSVIRLGNSYQLSPYMSDASTRTKYKNLIHIEQRLNHYNNAQLSSSGQDRLMRKNKPTHLSISLKNDLYNYFAKHLDKSGNPVAISNDLFALGCLIQWVWRSAIRKGEEIWLYIPAPRMRNLLIAWMNGEI